MNEELHEDLKEWSDCLYEECNASILKVNRKLKQRDKILELFKKELDEGYEHGYLISYLAVLLENE